MPSAAVSAPAEWSSWSRLAQVYVGQDTESAESRARLVQWVTALTPWLMAANVVAALLLAAKLPAAVAPAVRWSWCGGTCAIWLLGLRSWLRHGGRAPTRLGPAVVRKGALHAGLLSSLWALLPWTMFPNGNPAAQMMIAGVMPSMIAGAGFILCPIAPAAVVFALIVGVSSSAAVAMYPDPMAGYLAGLMAGFTGVVIVSVLFGARRAAGALRAEREAERQRQLVGLLLRDFESQSADVLWEIDAQGRFSRVSPKLMTLMQLEGEVIGRHTLLGWFEAQCREAPAQQAVARLRQAFATGQAFRQREIPVSIGGAARWWAITARPLVDEAGAGQGWRGVITDITLEHDAHSRMLQLALVDSLTGLANLEADEVDDLTAPGAGTLH